MPGPRWRRRPPRSRRACRRSTAARLPRPGLRASWLASLLERGIERVVEERGLRDRLVVVRAHQRKAARDGAEPSALWSDVQLVEVGPVHDSRERAERSIVRQPLLSQRFERAAAFAIAVRVCRPGSVETDGLVSLLHVATSSGATNRKLAAGSRKRRISHAVAVRLTRMLRRVTQFMRVDLRRAPARKRAPGRARLRPERRLPR